jgi:hypothetical protein
MPVAPATPKQKRIALAIALAADVAQLALAPLFAEGALSPFSDALDLVVVLTLVLTLGWRWRTVLALGVELIPGLALFPTWTALVLTMPTAQPVEQPQLSATRSAG